MDLEITRMSIDLAKSSFYVCGKNNKNEIVLSKKATAASLKKLLLDLNPCTVVMEACAGSNYWGRFAESHNHKVLLISPQHVKPFVTSNQKNDRNDALAILEASERPNMYFLKPKSEFCQELQSLLRSRELVVRSKVALTNHLRGLLMEVGITTPKGDSYLKKTILDFLSTPLEQNHFEFTNFQRLYSLLLNYEENILTMTSQIEKMSSTTVQTKKLMKVPGIGAISAAWFLAHMGDGSQFKNGRQASACLGLVPRQNSTGGRTKLLGITKQGNASVRTVLIHGARSYVRAVHLKGAFNKRDEWVLKLLETKGVNTTTVAVANKNARIMWSMLRYGTEFNVA